MPLVHLHLPLPQLPLPLELVLVLVVALEAQVVLQLLLPPRQPPLLLQVPVPELDSEAAMVDSEEITLRIILMP